MESSVNTFPAISCWLRVGLGGGLVKVGSLVGVALATVGEGVCVAGIAVDDGERVIGEGVSAGWQAVSKNTKKIRENILFSFTVNDH
jgi:hypothetical protein